MAVDSMSDSYLFQFEKYLDSNPYREYVMNRPYVRLSAHSNRLHKPSSIVFQQFINNQKNPLILDRIAYKLRIKSDLNVDTQREPLRHEHYHTNSPVNDSINLPTRAATTKTYLRQPTAATRTTNSMKTVVTDEFNGIEGNAVRVGTLNDLIRHFHQEEIRLIHRPTDDLDNLSNCTTNNRLMKERKTPAFASKRILKRPQTLTEYRFKIPPSLRTEYRTRLTDQYSLKQQSIDKLIQKSRAKTSFHTEKQISKLTIIDPFNFEGQVPSSHYIFPPARPFGYLTRKSFDDTPRLTSVPLRKKQPIKKLPKSPLNSLEQLSTDTDRTPKSLTEIRKSNTTLADLDDELDNPPNTIVNMNMKS